MNTPIFYGENYQLWVVRMETYLEAFDLWQVVEEDYEINPLLNNLIVARNEGTKFNEAIRIAEN